MRKGISGRRLERIEEQIAPLFARGLTQREIAKKLNISLSMIQKDCRLIQTSWDDEISERLESARAELVFKHDHLYRQCMARFDREPSPKWIELASKELECLGRLLGQAGPNINIHAHQHNVEVTAGAVAELFKPLDAAAYGAMVAAKPLPPAADAAELPVIELESEQGSDEWTTAEAAAPMPEHAEPAPAAEKIKRVAHPLGRR